MNDIRYELLLKTKNIEVKFSDSCWWGNSITINYADKDCSIAVDKINFIAVGDLIKSAITGKEKVLLFDPGYSDYHGPGEAQIFTKDKIIYIHGRRNIPTDIFDDSKSESFFAIVNLEDNDFEVYERGGSTSYSSKTPELEKIILTQEGNWEKAS